MCTNRHCAVFCIIHSMNSSSPPKVYPLCVSRHVIANSVVVEETLDAANGTDSHILIPQLPLSKTHYILLCDCSNDTLNLLWTHAATGSDDLASNIFCDSGSTVKGK